MREELEQKDVMINVSIGLHEVLKELVSIVGMFDSKV